LEEEIKREESESGVLIENKDAEIKYLKDDLTKIMSEYEDLMASKTDLEVEIRTYRKLLEGEENR
jgi:metal-responsive CopG/Arc/MetJ family transcriptional regulator